MNYLFYGTESYLMKKEIVQILKTAGIDAIDQSNYDLEETMLSAIIEDAETVSLFSSKKAIIVENSFIFTAMQKKREEQNTDLLINYLKHANPDTILIFCVSEEKIDERKKITKLMKEIGKVQCFAPLEQVNSFAKQAFEDYEIDYKTIDLLVERVGKDLNLLIREIEKLKLYKMEEKKIEKKDVLNLTSVQENIDIFELIEAIVSKDKEKAITIYHNMLKMNEEPIKIIVMLANQFRLIYQAKELYQRGHTEKDIASILNVHPYRIKLALGKGRGYQSDMLLAYLGQLADLDIGIKSGMLEKELGLELFILGIV